MLRRRCLHSLESTQEGHYDAYQYVGFTEMDTTCWVLKIGDKRRPMEVVRAGESNYGWKFFQIEGFTSKKDSEKAYKNIFGGQKRFNMCWEKKSQEIVYKLWGLPESNSEASRI